MWFISKLIDRHRRKKAVRRVELADNGLVFSWPDGRPIVRFRWDEVKQIDTYTVDCWSYDEICLAFRVGEYGHEVNESDLAFKQICDAVQIRFPSIPVGWYSVVMLPAFETNQRRLWP